jgi:hypothetical protein
MSDVKSKMGEWFSPQALITGGTLLVAIVLAYGDIKSDVRNTNTMIQQDRDTRQQADARADAERARLEARVYGLEQGRQIDREALIEIKTIVKRIDDRVPGKP